jgi:hypothetical protein
MHVLNEATKLKYTAYSCITRKSQSPILGPGLSTTTIQSVHTAYTVNYELCVFNVMAMGYQGGGPPASSSPFNASETVLGSFDSFAVRGSFLMFGMLKTV